MRLCEVSLLVNFQDTKMCCVCASFQKAICSGNISWAVMASAYFGQKSGVTHLEPELVIFDSLTLLISFLHIGFLTYFYSGLAVLSDLEGQTHSLADGQ